MTHAANQRNTEIPLEIRANACNTISIDNIHTNTMSSLFISTAIFSQQLLTSIKQQQRSMLRRTVELELVENISSTTEQLKYHWCPATTKNTPSCGDNLSYTINACNPHPSRAIGKQNNAYLSVEAHQFNFSCLAFALSPSVLRADKDSILFETLDQQDWRRLRLRIEYTVGE